ncbi:hypothetical protein ASZ78_011985 [Callipepla squamata]|uniref:Ubiquitin-like domain-containing protein n=1 Tax=Callipepla squamata TaxID=9009 RepID=A0A226N1A2_CALSU|nr:hypothetical protein ASZ78_011985 [Callipepla squamata]
MASKKEPPFFNEENMGPFYYKLLFYETMELFIETLTGMCFELRVSRFETVLSVKVKIQMLEGIPVSQQHLIWNSVELKDDYCLNDYNISEGCTLKLVLAMQGGPINTRRVPMKDPIREKAEYTDPSTDEIWEKKPSNKQVTFLVYREGDQNFFRVAEPGDGTSSPLSQSFSGGSVYNLSAADEDETEASPSGQQIFENSITMNKMKLLKAKMENMNLSKKTKKTVKVKPRPPTSPRPSSGSAAAAHHRFLRVLPRIGQSCLAPSGNSCPSEPSQNALTALTSLATAGRTMPSAANDFLKEDGTWQSNSWSQSVSSIRLPPKIPRVELGNAKIPTNSILTPVSSLPANLEQVSENVISTATEEDSVLYPNRTNVELYGAEEKPLSETGTFALFTEGNSTEQCREIYDIGKVNTERELSDGDEESKVIEQHKKPISKVLSTAAMGTRLLSTRHLSPQRSMLLLPLWYSSQVARHSSLKPQIRSKCFESCNLRVGEATHLPPVNGSIQAKKKIAKHCFLCGKKTGLATSYECRCGNNFCATHRYAETHACTYDYKNAGRRCLQATNPIVSAPKIPKI